MLGEDGENGETYWRSIDMKRKPMKKTKEKPPKKEKEKIFSDRSLMIRLDDLCYFTEEKNFPCLIEFARHFGAEISTIKTKDPIEIFDLDDLCKNMSSKKHEVLQNYDVVEIKLSAAVKKDFTRSEKILKGKIITEQIKNKFLSDGVLSLQELMNEHSDFGKTSMAHYLTKIKKELEKDGHQVIKEKPGFYRLVKKVEPSVLDNVASVNSNKRWLDELVKKINMWEQKPELKIPQKIEVKYEDFK